MADGLDGHLDLERRSLREMGASIVASAISFFNTGDHVVVVARPTWRPFL